MSTFQLARRNWIATTVALREMLMRRRQFFDVCRAAAAGLTVAATNLLRADAGKPSFSPKYEVLRKQFLRDFEYKGQVAMSANGQHRKFCDQTFHMGFALLTFAGEARVLQRAGHDPRPSEAVVRRLLNAFEQLDSNAERERYHTTVPGFFLRDYVKEWPGHDIESDFLASAQELGDDMSIDQVISLMMGWWAVSHWSTDEANRKLARSQAARVLDFLCDERFMIDRPGTHTSVGGGGDDARAAAGFLCHMGEQITGQDYYYHAKVRLMHDNKCHTCAGTGLVLHPNPNFQCLACSGTGHCKIVIAGGRCEVCRGTGDVKIVVQADCPACSGSGEIRLVVTNPITGEDHTIDKTKCDLCGGSGKIGGKTDLGKCKVCGGRGRRPQYTKDLGKCKWCGGSGRWKGELPKIKCLVCGGSKELNLYVTATHPIILGLQPLALVALNVPRIGMHKGKITIDSGYRNLAKSYVRHMNLVCMAFDQAVSDPALLAAAKDSNHPWAVALRAAMGNTVCPACQGHGKLFVMAPDRAQAAGNHHMPRPTFKRHDLGPCGVCRGKGLTAQVNPHNLILAGVTADLARLHRECPLDGPSVQAKPPDWCKSNRWERCTDLARDSGTERYNGLDFLSMEVLLRLAGAGDALPKPVASKTIKCEFTNMTKNTVQFRLNGGNELSTGLAPGKTAAYTLVVDAGTPPAVFIKQKNGMESTFALKDGDKYVFILRDGKIMNAYK